MVSITSFSLSSFMASCGLTLEISKTKYKWHKWEVTHHEVLTSVCSGSTCQAPETTAHPACVGAIVRNLSACAPWVLGLVGGRPGKSVAHSLPLLRRKQSKLGSGSRIKMVLFKTGGSELLTKGKDRKGVAGLPCLHCELGCALESGQDVRRNLETIPLLGWGRSKIRSSILGFLVSSRLPWIA